LTLRLLDAHKAAGAPGGVVQQIHHDEGGLTLTLQRSLEVRLPRDDLEGRMAKLATLLGRLEAAGHQAAWIHLNDARRPERVAVRLRSTPEVVSGG
jgi:cell division septal protein FtsQ